ncbi:MAG: ion channel [Gammaproteobacteria bacterium]|nr:ion channel [Gammaproteobacteria bacterium]
MTTTDQPPTNWRIVRMLGKQRYLAYSLLAFLCVLPFTHGQPGSRLMIYSALALVFITGPLAVARTRVSFRATCVLALLVLVPGVASAVGDHEWAFKASILVGVVFFAFLAALVSKELLFEEADVTAETLWAAVNVYVLIGLGFAFLYAALSLFGPDVFVGKFMDQTLRDQLQGFVYFSFVTLTTLGYGDITPNSAFVGTLTYLEALVGQLYVAIMIARLVGLYIARRG